MARETAGNPHRRANLLIAAVGLTLACATLPAGSRAQSCSDVRFLFHQGLTAMEIVQVTGVPRTSVQSCLSRTRDTFRAPGPAPHGAPGPAPRGAAGPAPRGAAGPAPHGAAGPAPHGAAGPAPHGAAGGTR